MKRMLAMLLTAVTVGVGANLTALAAPVTLEDGTIFDAAYYAQQNPDVVAALGTDSAVLYQHYVLFGQREGRKPSGDGATSTTATQDTTANTTTANTQENNAVTAQALMGGR